MLRTSLALAACAVLLLVASSSGSGGGLDAAHPVAVGSTRLAAAPLPAMERRIEAAWLRDEARVLGLSGGPGLRDRVADALAGPRGQGIPAAFARFHERHRAATRCLEGATDPYADRCVDRPAAPDGSCRWMGEASLCRVEAGAGRRVWLVVQRSRDAQRFRRHGAAIAALRRMYLRARESRERAARSKRAARARRLARQQRARAAAQRRAEQRRRAAERRAEQRRRAAARRARLADPRLAAASLPRARRACVLHRREAEPYAFALGMQDPAGQADGLLAARATFRARLQRAAVDGIDRRKLRRLLRAMAAGDGALRRMRSAPDLDLLYRALSDYDGAQRREARLAAGLGLPDCAG